MSRLSRALGVLHYPDYRLLWAAGLVSLVGDAMHNVAEGWLVFDLTGSPSALSTTFALTSAPVALLTLVGGVYADRWDRKQTLILVNAARLAMVAVLGLLTLTGLVQVWHVWAMAAGMGLLTGFGGPAIQSLLPSLVPAAAVSAAIGFNIATSSLGGIAGRSLGGWLVGTAGIWPVFVINALTFLAPVVTLQYLRRRAAASPAAALAAGPQKDRRAFWRDLGEGVAYLRAHPSLAAVLLVWSSFSLFEAPTIWLAPVFARDILLVGPQGLGLLFAAFSAGFFVGSLAAGRWAGRVSRALPFATTGMGATLFMVVYAWSTAFLLTLLALAGIGWFIGFMGVTQQSIMTAGTPDAVRGRVLSINMVGLSAPLPLGNFMLGALAERWGAPFAVGACGVALLAVLATVAGSLAWATAVRRPGGAAPDDAAHRWAGDPPHGVAVNRERYAKARNDGGSVKREE